MFRRVLRACFRQCITPQASVVFLAALAWCVWRVPSADASAASIRGLSLPGWKIGTARPLATISLYVLRDAGQMRVEDTETRSTDGLLAALRRDPDDVLRAIITYQRLARGWLDVVRFDDHYDLELRPLGKQVWSDAETDSARAAVLGWLESRDLGNKPFVAAGLRDPDRVRRRWNVPGIWNTALMLLSAGLLAVSLAWVPALVRQRRVLHRSRALAAGLCPGCGYSMGTLSRCPECGSPVSR